MNRFRNIIHYILPKLNQNAEKIGFFLLSIFLLSIGIFLAIRFLENRAFQSRIQVKELKNFITYAIQNDMDKAVDLGIIGFSLREGVIVEDLIISSEVDFSSSKKLLHSKKLVLKLSSLFQPNPYIRKLRFVEPKLSLNSKDPFFSKLVDYILDANIQEVEFIDAEIEVYQGESDFVKWNGRTDWSFKRDGNLIHFQFSNGFYYLPWGERLKGSGTVTLDPDGTKNFTLHSEWKNLSASGFRGYVEWISGLSLRVGTLSGKSIVEFQKDQWKIRSENILRDTVGEFSILEDLNFSGFDFSVDSLIKIDSSSKIPRSESKQEFKSEFGNWLVEWKEENGLHNGRVEWDFGNLLGLSEKIDIPYGLKISGSWKGNLNWEETGIRNKWFLFSGEQVWKDGKIEREGFRMDLNSMRVAFDKPNILNFTFDGKLFDSPWKWSTNLELQFWRSTKADGTVYYPLGTKGSISGNLGEIRVEDWEGIFYSIYDILEKDVNERMEKLILQDYFTEFPIYRYLLEEMNVSWNISIGKVVTSTLGEPIVDWTFDGSIKQGATRMELYQKGKGNRAEFNTRFATKFPYLDFRLVLEEIPWKRKFGSFCGVEYTVDSLSTDIRARSTGADTYDISRSAAVTSDWRFTGWTPVYSKGIIQDKIPENGWSWSLPSDLSYEWSYYGENQYYRNMEFNRENGDSLKGNGASKGELILFSFYGKSGEESLKFNLEDTGKGCR